MQVKLPAVWALDAKVANLGHIRQLLLPAREVQCKAVRYTREKNPGHLRQDEADQTVIELLEESVGGKGKKKSPVRYHDLDHLAGTWTKEEAAALEAFIAEQRTIDPELWK